jgi:hypothetical protein
MMTDFVTIAEAKRQLKGNILFKVISLGELKTGNTKTGSTYEKQDAVIKDNSGAMNLTLWNESIGKLDPGTYYSLESAYWTEYKNEAQLSLGNYYELKKITEEEFTGLQMQDPNQTTIAQSAKTAGDVSPQLTVGVSQKLDEILHEIDLIKNMVEPLFKKMVDDQIGVKINE